MTRATMQMAQDYLERIKELEKENAELKERVEKAEDLIEDMYDRIPASHSDYYKDVMERARQFLWGQKMTKEEIQKNSEHWYNKYKDAEKRITDLEKDKAYAEEQLDEQIQATLNLQKENAGLKAGRPQWHKADVPTNPINKEVLGCIKDYNSKKFCLVKWNGEWWYDTRTWNDKVKLIAWCEIPSFDKE